MKKPLVLLFTTSLLLSFTSCKKEGIDMAVINKELEGCYNYFMGTTNYTEGSLGFGLTRDRLTKTSLCSIAATGFLLASYPVFVEEGYMEKDRAKDIVDKTFDTVLRIQADSETSYEGCISHFVDMNTGKREGTSEISTIDTAILVSGVVTAAQYFKDGLVEKGNTIWGNVNFNKFTKTKGGKEHISMGTSSPNGENQLSPWDYYAEQLMIYILGAGNPNLEHRISNKYYKNITKNFGSYDGISHVYSWYGSLFTYQYSQAFFNFKRFNDPNGINYYENSVKASQTAYRYSKTLARNYKTFDSPAWGLTACDTPFGYNGELGTPPRGFDGSSASFIKAQGTVAPTAAIGSMPFTPTESYNALKYYQSLERLNSKSYGLMDSYNLNVNGVEWYDPDIIGIDKGIEVLQLYNYKNTDFVSNLAMENPYVINGFLNNGFIEVK